VTLQWLENLPPGRRFGGLAELVLAEIRAEASWPKASDASDRVAVKARKRSHSGATARFRNAGFDPKIRAGRREEFFSILLTRDQAQRRQKSAITVTRTAAMTTGGVQMER